jgi:microcystin degradation protein MlrC
MMHGPINIRYKTVHYYIKYNRIRMTHTSGQNSLIWEKRISRSRVPQSKFHIPLIIPSVEFSTENQPIRKQHKQLEKKEESKGSHALTVT